MNADGFDDALFTSQLDEQVLIYFGGPDARLENPLVIPTRRSGLPAHAVDIDGERDRKLEAARERRAECRRGARNAERRPASSPEPLDSHP